MPTTLMETPLAKKQVLVGGLTTSLYGIPTLIDEPTNSTDRLRDYDKFTEELVNLLPETFF